MHWEHSFAISHSLMLKRKAIPIFSLIMGVCTPFTLRQEFIGTKYFLCSIELDHFGLEEYNKSF